jgi:selenide,water dikinase
VAGRLVLVGGGHAHLEVLRRAARRPIGAELVLVSPHPAQLYSGMMPGQLRGAYAERDLTVDLPALCRAAGARFVEAAVVRVGAEPHTASGATVHADGAPPLEASHVSLDVGSVPAGLDDVPGARAHAHAVRPLARWRALAARVDALAAEGAVAGPLAACVVGGGAGGVEIALALHARAAAAGRAPEVTLVEGGDRVLPSFETLGGRVRRLMERRGVRVRTGVRVAAVDDAGVTLQGGARVPSRVTVWTAGAAAPPLVRASGLPADPGGYLRVDATLRAVDGRPVWGAGDCVALDGADWVPKAGVYAVREAPVLAANLRAALGGGAARRYAPQRHYLVALDTADGRAFLRRGGVPFGVHAAWALRLKRAIDERFVARYQAAGTGGLR